MYKGFPSVIRVGAMPVRVLVLDEISDGAAWGDFDCIKYLIRLDNTIPSPAKAVEVVLHEIMHAIYRFAAIGQNDDEERTVTAFSTWLAMVLMDNPLLVKWLVNTTKS